MNWPIPRHAPRTTSLLAPLVLAGTLAGCATTAPPVLASGGTTTEITSATGRMATISGDDASSKSTLHAAPIGQVWQALLSALPAVGVPLELINENAWTAGTAGVAAKGTFAGRRISTFLSCGGSAGVIEVANDHYVTIRVLATLVRPAEGTVQAPATELRVQVGGSAKDPFTSVPPRQCVSRGVLEARIDSTVRARLQGRQ